MSWCDPNGPNPKNNVCDHDRLDSYVEKIQAKFGNQQLVLNIHLMHTVSIITVWELVS